MSGLPRPQRTYEAQIGLEEMEEQVSKTAPANDKLIARWALEALAFKAECHFAHLQSLVAVMNCTLCRTSIAGSAVIKRALTALTTNAAAPYLPLATPTQNFQAPGWWNESHAKNTAGVSPKPPPALMS